MDSNDIGWIITFILMLFISPGSALFFGVLILIIIIFDIEI